MTASKGNLFLIVCTFIVAFIFTILPMPSWAIWLRPVWILIALIYWSMVRPDYVSIGIAWTLGIFLDVLEGTILGEHAFAFSIVTYLVVRMHSRLSMYHLFQQSLIIFLLVLLYQIIIFGIQGFVDTFPGGWLYLGSPLTSMLLWPWVYGILNKKTEV
ncbi:rod shape-determining protein MreD [Gammaproteobacteria bacterium]|nr:rod shape-determining protein MreD [Gammaproteobacteria bacterium]